MSQKVFTDHLFFCYNYILPSKEGNRKEELVMTNNVAIKENNKVEDLLTFYNRFLSLDNDDYLLMNLVYNLVECFISKIPKEQIEESLYDPDFDYEKIMYNASDRAKLCQYERSCITFHHDTFFNLSEDLSFYMDQFGVITYIETNLPEIKCYEKKSALEFLESFSYMSFYKPIKHDVLNIISQNILVSKIWHVILEMIKNKAGIKYGMMFSLLYHDILSYQEKLAKLFPRTNEEEETYSRLRSRR